MTPAHFPGVAGLIEEELARFRDTHPASAGLHDTAPASLLSGVPMQWMVHWPGSYPIYVQHAAGGHLVDVDGHDYVDFCLGDSGAMAGHSPGEVIAAATARLARGVTFMLPTADAIAAAEHLARRFGLPIWQFTLSATDANRAAIRYARGLTRRPKILIFNHSYHGGVDETFATLDHGSVVSPATSLGPPVDPAVTTNVAEFNDIGAVEGALAAGDIAAVLTEPAPWMRRTRCAAGRAGTPASISSSRTLSWSARQSQAGCRRVLTASPPNSGRRPLKQPRRTTRTRLASAER